MSKEPYLSIIIPVYNEEENVTELYKQLHPVLSSAGIAYEILFIDDGSTDKTLDRIKEIMVKDKNVRVIQFQRNFGKSAALSCGFSNANGDIIITMDGDLQDNPKEIPRFIEELKKYDVVSGWKFDRQDPLSKTIPSKIFNFLTRLLTGIKIHDCNCGYKAYKQYVIKNINLYGELHRYIPSLAHWKGYSVGEIKVEHRERMHGKSKYGSERFLKGFFDIITIKFLMAYADRPLHLFGGFGLTLCVFGITICTYLLILRIKGEAIGGRPLLLLGVLLIILGIQFFSMGLIGELIRNSRENRNYVIKYDAL